MYFLALSIGIFSYVLFLLGLVGLLQSFAVGFVTAMFVVIITIRYRSYFTTLTLHIPLSQRIILVLFFLLIGVNILGVFAPELAFDALWYHLTLPKLYIQEQKIFFIPGGLLYYSAMPKLIEILYIPALLFGNEHFAKLIHFTFGLLTSYVIFRVTRKYYDKKWAVVAALIFYSNLVVAWESTTAYIDLGRAFFEIIALYAFLEYIQKRNFTILLLSACFVGFAIASKLLAVGTLGIFLSLIIFDGIHQKEGFKNVLVRLISFLGVTLLIVLPWLVFSYYHTGNPLYPLFTNLYLTNFSWNLLSPLNFLKDTMGILLFADDPISPLYLIVLPLLFLYFKKFGYEMRLITLYSILALIVWYITPRTGGGRFILAYLPAFSIIATGIIASTPKVEQKFLYGIVCLIGVITIVYRVIAEIKYLPLVLGQQSTGAFMSKNMDFAFGDFYDIDGKIESFVKPQDKVLVIGIHNLFYVPGHIIHESYIAKGDTFSFILIRDKRLPNRFTNVKLLYTNTVTNVKLYQNENSIWTY